MVTILADNGTIDSAKLASLAQGSGIHPALARIAPYWLGLPARLSLSAGAMECDRDQWEAWRTSFRGRLAARASALLAAGVRDAL